MWYALHSNVHCYVVMCVTVIHNYVVYYGREMAQLQLAERIIAEKEHELHEVGARADQFMMEKEFLEEELATVRTSMNVSSISQDLNVATPSSPPPTTRVSETPHLLLHTRSNTQHAVEYTTLLCGYHFNNVLFLTAYLL